jgi:hypothetical protein
MEECTVSSQEKVKNEQRYQIGPEPLLTRNEIIVLVGMILVTMGLVFFLAEGGTIDWGSPWWTLFIGIPGLVFLEAGIRTVRHQRRLTPMAVFQFALGGIATLIALLFILDPNWEFMQGWTLFSGGFWDSAWRWIIVLAGAAILVAAFLMRSVLIGVLGAIVIGVGAVFVFDLDWGRIWPLFIVAVGLGVLALLFDRRR